MRANGETGMRHASDPAQGARVRALAEEYVALVEQMREGRYDGDEEYHILSGQRGLVHDELIALTGLADRKAMYAYCREFLANTAQSAGEMNSDG
jgi:hypothetical protein